MTKVNWNRQLGLAVVLFVFGSLAYWLEFKHKPEQEDSDEGAKKVFQVKDSQVESVQVTTGPTTFLFKCSDLAQKLCKPNDHSKWEVAAPVQVKGDDPNLNSLLSALNSLAATETINLKQDSEEKRQGLLKEYGLDARSRELSRRVEILYHPSEKKPEETKTAVLTLGEASPMGDSIFALLGKDETKVYLIPSHFRANLDHDLTYWRNKKLLTLSAHEVESFQLKNTNVKVQAARRQGQWVIHSLGTEADLTGDVENIDSMLSSIVYMAAKEFASDQKTDAKAKAILKTAKPIIEVVLQREKGTAKEAPAPLTLTLYQGPASATSGQTKAKDAKPNLTAPLYATVSNLDPLFEIDFSTRGRLDKDMKFLRQTKLITSMERFAAKKIEFSGAPIGTQPLTLEDSAGKWVKLPEKQEIETEKLQSLLEKLAGNRIQSFHTGSQIPKGQDSGVRMVLKDAQNALKKDLIFWKSGNHLFARDLTSQRAEAFLVDPIVVEALPWSATFFSKAEKK